MISPTAIVANDLPEEAEQHARLLQNPYNVDDPTRRIAKLTPGLKRKFCEALAQGASVTKAAQAIGVAKSTAYYQRSIDPQFREAWVDALDSAADLCEDRLAELRKESTHPAFVFGSLKVLRPEKWGDKPLRIDQRNVTVSVGLPAVQEQELLAIIKRSLESGTKLLPSPLVQ